MDKVWNLVADIGGTNARFSAMVDGQLESKFQYLHSVEEYPKFEDLICILLQEIASETGWHNPPNRVCFAVACQQILKLLRLLIVIGPLQKRILKKTWVAHTFPLSMILKLSLTGLLN